MRFVDVAKWKDLREVVFHELEEPESLEQIELEPGVLVARREGAAYWAKERLSPVLRALIQYSLAPAWSVSVGDLESSVTWEESRLIGVDRSEGPIRARVRVIRNPNAKE
jgi:hypothetical protein